MLFNSRKIRLFTSDAGLHVIQVAFMIDAALTTVFLLSWKNKKSNFALSLSTILLALCRLLLDVLGPKTGDSRGTFLGHYRTANIAVSACFGLFFTDTWFTLSLLSISPFVVQIFLLSNSLKPFIPIIEIITWQFIAFLWLTSFSSPKSPYMTLSDSLASLLSSSLSLGYSNPNLGGTSSFILLSMMTIIIGRLVFLLKTGLTKDAGSSFNLNSQSDEVSIICIAGSPDFDSAREMLDEIFHEEHSDRSRQFEVYLFRPRQPVKLQKYCEQHKTLSGRVRVIDSDVFDVPEALKKVIRSARFLLIMPCISAEDAGREDTENISRLLSLRPLISEGCRVAAVFNLIENSNLIQAAGMNVSSLALENYKYELFGSASRILGYQNLVYSLCKTIGEYPTTSELWRNEFEYGLGCELYEVPIPSAFFGHAFIDVFRGFVLNSEEGEVYLIGIIENLGTKDESIKLNPGPNYRFPLSAAAGIFVAPNSESILLDFTIPQPGNPSWTSGRRTQQDKSHGHYVLCLLGFDGSANVNDIIAKMKWMDRPVRVLGENIEAQAVGHVVFYRGSPLNKQDILQLDLTSATGTGYGESRIPDSDALVAFMLVKSVSPAINILCELHSSHTLFRLTGTDDADFFRTEAFASGNYLISTSISEVLANSVFNPSILKLCNALCVANTQFVQYNDRWKGVLFRDIVMELLIDNLMPIGIWRARELRFIYTAPPMLKTYMNQYDSVICIA